MTNRNSELQSTLQAVVNLAVGSVSFPKAHGLHSQNIQRIYFIPMTLQGEVSSLWAAGMTSSPGRENQRHKEKMSVCWGRVTLSWHLSKQPQNQCLEIINISLSETESRRRFAQWFRFRVSFEVAIKYINWDWGFEGSNGRGSTSQVTDGASGRFLITSMDVSTKLPCMATILTQTEWAKREHST